LAQEGSASDVAYAICVLSKTFNSGMPDAVQPDAEVSPGKEIERLSSAENELRKARILVSLDRSKGELLTFYRKEDLQRDGKSIFNRVLTILRKNECQIASKHTVKTADLLRPDQADRGRLHRLFVYAISSMIKSEVKQNENLVALDLNTFVFQVTPNSRKQNGSIHELGDIWRPLNLNIQILPRGQVIVINRQDTLATFRRLSSVFHGEGAAAFLANPTKVLLALIGQYARYAGGYVGKLPCLTSSKIQGANSSDPTGEAILETYRQRMWKDSVEQLLAENEFELSIDEDDWIELEVPLCDASEGQPISPNGFLGTGRIIWKPIFWPSSLCYVNTVDHQTRGGTDVLLHSFEDPLQFVEDWIASASDREAASKTTEQDVKASVKPDRAEDLDMTNSDNMHVDASQSFRRVTSLDGQVATIYPTPPDVALSHVTPGMVSVDGMAATPGDGTMPVQPDRTEHNVDMTDIAGNQAAIGSGLYDEDLFEDVPGEKFGEAEMADEPNWDFFDEPDADMIEGAESMDLDAPEKPVSAVAENPTLDSGEVERVQDEIMNDSTENHDGVVPTAVEDIPDAKVMTFPLDAKQHVDEGSSRPSEVAIRSLISLTGQPLSPAQVKKTLFPDLAIPMLYQVNETAEGRLNRRALLKNHFAPDLFQAGLKVADSRYSTNGTFWFEAKEAGRPFASNLTDQYREIPRIGIPKKKRSAALPETPGNLEPPNSPSSAEETDFDSSDFFSDSNKHGSPARSNEVEAASLPVSPHPAEDVLDADTKLRIRREAMRVLELLRPEANDLSFCRFNQPLQRPISPNLLISRDAFLTIAQVMVDQVSQSFFQYNYRDGSLSLSDASNLDMFQQLQFIYGECIPLDLARLAEMPTGAQDTGDGDGLADSPSPLIQLARSDVRVDALPTIQAFWETLGLQPVNSKKNITAICIHPAGTHIREGSSAFLQRFSEIYSNCNLGTHSAGNVQDVTSNGLIEWEVKVSQAHGLLQICEHLGSSLATFPSSAENIIIHVVNPFKDRGALADICIAFVALFTSYAKACGRRKGNELVLQIIPMSFIASSDTVVIPSQTEYLSLALEVYNRCPLIDSAAALAESAAAVTLAKSVPKSIMFNLASDAASPLSKDGETLHLAYSQSVDLRWITACWSDTLGKTALTMTYCLYHKGSSASRSRSEIIKELWEISEDIMINACGKWRLFVAHDGVIESDEVNEWSFLANQNASSGTGSSCALTLLTFDVHPSLQFSPPTPHSKPQAIPVITATGKYGTPASTPSAVAMTSSPEQLTASTPIPPTPGASGLLAAPTPPDQSSHPTSHGFDMTTDPDTTLIDPTDECWTLILPFGLNNSHSPLESRPALLSGFLLKRRGPLDCDGLVALGANLIYYTSYNGPMTKPEHKSLLREVLDQWRGLYTLARTKSLAASDSVLPWHVRTAVVGCRVVSEIL
jgi:mediator of RNA polymerase II transcription subunit 13, fungi type